MCRICKIERDRIDDFIPELNTFLDSRNICMRGQAVWALGELAVKAAAFRMHDLLHDSEEVWIFEHEAVVRKSIGTIAREALGKMGAG